MRLVGEDNSDGKHVGVRQKRGHSGREARLGRSWNGLAVQTFRRLDPNEPCFEIIADLIWAFKKCMTAPWAYSATQRLLMTRDGVAKKKKGNAFIKDRGTRPVLYIRSGDDTSPSCFHILKLSWTLSIQMYIKKNIPRMKQFINFVLIAYSIGRMTFVLKGHVQFLKQT